MIASTRSSWTTRLAVILRFERLVLARGARASVARSIPDGLILGRPLCPLSRATSSRSATFSSRSRATSPSSPATSRRSSSGEAVATTRYPGTNMHHFESQPARDAKPKNSIDARTSAPLTAQEAKRLESLEKSLPALHRYASNVAAYVRRVLIDDYPDENNEQNAIHRFLRDTMHARRLVEQVGDLIGDNKHIGIERRIAVNLILNNITSLFHFNQTEYNQLKSEPVLWLAETSIGMYRWGDSLESRSIDELARLGYLASMRPGRLLASLYSIDNQSYR